MYVPGDDSVRSLDGSASTGGGSASLTYEPFFGLREKPFSLSADPRFLYRSPAHGPAFDAILAGIRRREGLIVLTGEIGTGKTTLCRSVLQHLDRRTFAAFVPDPFVSREDLLKTLLVDFGVITVSDVIRGRFNGSSRSELSYPLYEFLDSLVPLQAFAVLVIDEAQNLSLPLLEEIRILSELERREKLLQVVLIGQPELRSNLRLPQMRQVDQRVSVRCELAALDAEGVVGYVNHRLIVAGLGGSTVEFTPAALDALYEGSAGVPRVINRLCDRALARAGAAQTRRIDPQFIWDAIDDLGYARRGLDRAADEKPATEPGIVAAAPVPAPIAPPQMRDAAPIAAVKLEADSPLMEEFRSEFDLEMPDTTDDSARRRQWATVALVSMLIVLGSVGVPAWYVRMHKTVADASVIKADDTLLVAPQSPALSGQISTQNVAEADANTVDQAISADQASAASGVTPTTEQGRYTILVASFTNHERAQRLAEELTSAGYQARTVEHDWGPPRGLLVQVNVGSYDSVDDGQRDLQVIRGMPGYGDARIVGRP